MFLTKRIYCDFVLWTEKEIHNERILPDDQFRHNNVVNYVEPYFNRAILPEVLGKFYSRTNDTIMTLQLPSSTSRSPSPKMNLEPTYCYCKGPGEGEMVECHNQSCTCQWMVSSRLYWSENSSKSQAMVLS